MTTTRESLLALAQTVLDKALQQSGAGRCSCYHAPCNHDEIGEYLGDIDLAAIVSEFTKKEAMTPDALINPCPFCGNSDVRIWLRWASKEKGTMWTVRCQCSAEGPFVNSGPFEDYKSSVVLSGLTDEQAKAEAVRLWNARGNRALPSEFTKE